MAGEPPRRYFTVREVAELYHVDLSTLRRWIAKGAVRPTKIGPSGPGQRPRLRLSAAEVKKLAQESAQE